MRLGNATGYLVEALCGVGGRLVDAGSSRPCRPPFIIVQQLLSSHFFLSPTFAEYV